MNKVTHKVGCVESATRVIGDKWTPLLLRFFINNKAVRFTQLQELVGGINPRTLSARLQMLESEEIIEKVRSNSTRCEYTITNKGRELTPVLKSMEVWSDKYEA